MSKRRLDAEDEVPLMELEHLSPFAIIAPASAASARLCALSSASIASGCGLLIRAATQKSFRQFLVNYARLKDATQRRLIEDQKVRVSEARTKASSACSEVIGFHNTYIAQITKQMAAKKAGSA